MNGRDAFLQRVKQAVHEGNPAGPAPRLPEGASVGYQGGGADPAARFGAELALAGGKAYLAADADAAVRTILSILQPLNARKVLLSRGGLVDRLNLPARLKQAGLEVVRVASPEETGSDAKPTTREDFFAADVGITNVYRLIAETGTVVVAANPHEPRTASLLPPIHIALADRSQLLPDLFDLFDLFAPTGSATQTLPPSCLTLITGPSKTGDIELRLVTGVHGPGEVHVILLS